MIQIYQPNLLVSATRGWCLKYVDDAGNAPARTATARYAWGVEKQAGRIRMDMIPENVWLVGFLDFTSGQYISYGHVFLMKRTGETYQIYDSEVQGGARSPYKSLTELLAWFGAYKPIYLGWSTHCDGREYAKERSNMEDQDISNIIREVWGIPANANNLRDYRGMNPIKFMYHILGDKTPWMDRKNRETNLTSQNKSLQEQLEAAVGGEYERAGELFGETFYRKK